ncbi:MAG: tRNA 2-thiouridine(34) synthase MnmA [Candidatus Moraniibacteriota bacterium]
MSNEELKLKKCQVLVGMSGGVDSSVTALLLQKEGYEVSGVFLDFIGGDKSGKDFQKAQAVAKKLNISIDKIDAREIFKKEIIDKFVADYEKGITPNPCVFCNPEMKFKILIEEADKRKIQYVSTGHYARIVEYESSSMEHEEIPNIKYQISNKFQISNLAKRIGDIFEKKSQSLSVNYKLETVNYSLSVARDHSKDQSYFLYRLTQEQLARIIFPLGDYLKSEVREIAKENGFEIKNEEESQDICFIANNDFGKFIGEKVINKPGEIVDKAGKTLGKHQGLHFYTIGQRKGINLGGDGPYFVIEKRLANNQLVVSNDIGDLACDEFGIIKASWINSALKFPLLAKTVVRYHGQAEYATIEEDGMDSYRVKLKNNQRAITPGQSAVFYTEQGEVLGGGIIV